MNRRDLFRFFGAAALASALPDLSRAAFEGPEDEPLVIPPNPLGVPYIGSLSAFGTAKRHVPVRVGLRRGEQTVFEYGLSSFGGALHWLAPPGQEILVPEGYPINVFTGPGADVYALLRKMDSLEVLSMSVPLPELAIERLSAVR
jgi:hypothetical protein